MARIPYLILSVGSEAEEQFLRNSVLRGVGYSVAPAQPEQAIRVFCSEAVDLVILSGSLSDEKRREIARQIKELKPDVPILSVRDDLQQTEDTDAVVSGQDSEALLSALRAFCPTAPRTKDVFLGVAMIVDNSP